MALFKYNVLKLDEYNLFWNSSMMADGLKDIDSCCLMIQSIENLLISAALVSQCSAYVSPDGTSTIEDERTFDCVRNGMLMAGGAMALGVP